MEAQAYYLDFSIQDVDVRNSMQAIYMTLQSFLKEAVTS